MLDEPLKGPDRILTLRQYILPKSHGKVSNFVILIS